VKRILLIPLAVLVMACDDGTPTVIPTVTPRTTAERVCALETRLARLEYTVGELLIILKEFEGVK